ncbi:MAG: CvpA family protein [Pseudomonadota bacterium]
MEGFTLVDGGVALVVVLSGLLAYARGFTREAMAIVGWIASAIVAFLLAGRVEPLVKEIPFVGEYLRGSCELAIIAAFAAVFAIALVLMSIFTPLFASMIQRSALSGIDRGLGFFFGVLRGLLLIAVAFVVYDRVVINESLEIVDNSRTAEIFGNVKDTIDEQIPEDAPGWIVQQYELLVSNCEA